MNDDLIPNWIKKIKDQDEAKQSEEERNRLHNFSTQQLVQVGALKFWKGVAKDLEIAVNALSKTKIKATCTSTSSPANPSEHGVRIDVSAGFPFVKIAHTVVWYNEGTGYIRCYFMEEPEKRIQFGIDPLGEVCAVGERGGMLDAEKTAEEILSPLVCFVRSHSR
jgi:hypothetical protein